MSDSDDDWENESVDEDEKPTEEPKAAPKKHVPSVEAKAPPLKAKQLAKQKREARESRLKAEQAAEAAGGGASADSDIDEDEALLTLKADEREKKVEKVVEQSIEQVLTLDDFQLKSDDDIKQFASKIGHKLVKDTNRQHSKIMAFLSELLKVSTEALNVQSINTIRADLQKISAEKGRSQKKSKQKQKAKPKIARAAEVSKYAAAGGYDEGDFDDFM